MSIIYHVIIPADNVIDYFSITPSIRTPYNKVFMIETKGQESVTQQLTAVTLHCKTVMGKDLW